MGRTKDVFWNYAVEEPNDRFRCKFCSRVFAGGIPRVKSHLSGVKGRGIAICSAVREEVQVAARSALDGTSFDKAKVAAASSETVSNIEVASTSSKLVIPYFSTDVHGKDPVMVHTELARFLMSNSIAFDVVDSQSFGNFVTGVAGSGLQYKLPSSEVLKTEFVPNVEKEAAAYIKDVRKSWGTTGCTIMLDTGTEYSNLFAYCPRGAIYLDSCKISNGRTADVDVKNIVAAAIEDIGAENVVQFITNDASAFRSAKDLLDSKYPKIYKVQCVANRLHLLFKDIYEKVELVKLTIDRAELIVDCLYEDVALLSLMKQYTDNTELKRPCSGAFASNYQMLQTVIRKKDGLRQIVESTEWGSSLASNKTVVTTIVRTPEFWREGQEVLETLKPLIQVLSLVEDNGATSGYLYAAMKTARKAIEERFHYSDDANILELYKQRRDDILHPIHAAAAFLNPAYMCHESFEEDSAMKESFSYIIEKMVADHERQQFALEVQLYRNKIPKLFSIMAKEMLESSHPSLWWEYCGDCVPVLRKCALRILSQPCKCIWEHKFSATKVARRRKPDGELRMNMNVKLMEMYTNLRTDLLRPICLENCHELPNYDDCDQGLEGNNKEPSGKGSTCCAKNGVELILVDEVEGLEGNNKEPSGKGSTCCAKNGVELILIDEVEGLEGNNKEPSGKGSTCCAKNGVELILIDEVEGLEGNNKEPSGKGSTCCAKNGVELILIDEVEVPEEEHALNTIIHKKTLSQNPNPGFDKLLSMNLEASSWTMNLTESMSPKEAGQKRSREEESRGRPLEPASTRVCGGSGEVRASQGDIISFGALGGTLASASKTLVSSFFADGSPESESRSFSQLLAGAKSPPLPAGNDEGKPAGDRPANLSIPSWASAYTTPPGLSPLEGGLPGFFGWFSHLSDT